MPGRFLLVCLALLAATALAYAPTLQNRFVNYDDDLYVTDVQEVREGLSGEGWAWSFSTFQGANWFPLTRLSWMLDAELFGMEPSGFHATSALLHALNALLLLAALVRLTGALGPSAFVAAIFAVHPLHVESVAWVSARKDVLSGLFFMLALLIHERVARSPRHLAWSAALLLVAALGLMAKPMLVTLPCVLLLLDLWPLGRLRDAPGAPLDRARLRAAVVEKLPLFALVAAASVVTVMAQRAGGALQASEHYPLGLRAVNAVDSVALYLKQAVWPVGLSPFYPHPLGTLPTWRVTLAAAVVGGATALAVGALRRGPWLSVGWFWFVGMLVPVSGLVQVGQAARADRYSYLPLIGITIAVAWSARAWARGRPGPEALLRRSAVVVVLLLCFASASQVEVWRTSTSLWEHALAVTERNHVAKINLALERHRAGRHGEAEALLGEAIVWAPGSAIGRGLRGEVRLALDRPEEALVDLRAAARMEPEKARWRSGLGRALYSLGQLEAAEKALRRALELNPEAPEIRAHLGFVLVRRERGDEAIGLLRAALDDPEGLERALGVSGLALVRAQLGGALVTQGQVDAALVELDEAVRLDPGNGVFHGHRGALLERAGRTAEAAEAYREALVQGERSRRVLNNLAWILATHPDARLRSPAEAVSLAEEADAAGDPDASILDTLAVARAAAGRGEEAIEAARRGLAVAEAQGETELAAGLRARLADLERGSASAQ